VQLPMGRVRRDCVLVGDHCAIGPVSHCQQEGASCDSRVAREAFRGKMVEGGSQS